jgi:integrase
MKLNDAIVNGLRPPESAAAKLYTDDSIPHFAVRVTKAGAKSFVLTVGRERQRITIGRYPIVTLAHAREKARKILAERELGIVHAPSPTFRAVKTEYLGRRDGEVRSGTLRGDTYLFKHFDGLLSSKLIDITPAVIERILDGIEAPSTRRSAYLRISGLFGYAVRRGYVDRSPVNVLEPPPDQAPRHRVLSDDELRKVLTTARMRRLAGDPYGAIVELLIYTGQRRQQIAGLTSSMVDFRTETITWPAELMKTGKRHAIPFGKLARAVLEPIDATALYFPTRIGQPFTGWSYHFRKLTQEVGFSDWVLHDLRRTLATKWQEMGIEIATTEKMLSHSAVTGGLVGIYQRSNYLAQMRIAVETWERYLNTLLFEMEDTNGRGDVRDLCTA